MAAKALAWTQRSSTGCWMACGSNCLASSRLIGAPCSMAARQPDNVVGSTRRVKGSPPETRDPGVHRMHMQRCCMAVTVWQDAWDSLGDEGPWTGGARSRALPRGQRLGASVYELPPGATGGLYHF